MAAAGAVASTIEKIAQSGDPTIGAFVSGFGASANARDSDSGEYPEGSPVLASFTADFPIENLLLIFFDWTVHIAAFLLC